MKIPALAPVALVVACGSAAPAPDATPHAMHGHHGPHRFQSADEWAKAFDDPARDAWQKPDQVVAALALADDAVVADIGSGTGYFAMRLARAVPKGKVFGVDVEPDMARYLRERAAREGLPNVVSLLSPVDDPRLPEPVDLVLVVNTVHHIEGRSAYFAKVRGALKPGGRVVIVDFKLGDLPVGPPAAMRLAPATVTAELAAAGLVAQSLDEATLPYQYIASYVAGPAQTP